MSGEEWQLRYLWAILVVFGTAASAESPAGRAWTVDSIPWQAQGAHGTRFALLEGDRAVAAPFTYAFSIPAGVWDAPHAHSQTVRVFVARGVLRIGYGDRVDHAAAHAYSAGSVVIVPGRARHFDGADVDTVIVGVAHGPWTTRYVDGSAPASAGTPIGRN